LPAPAYEDKFAVVYKLWPLNAGLFLKKI
jgi:hypothetical protein